MAPPASRLAAQEADEGDPLRALRDRFVIEPGGPLYVDGNSLGRLPRSTAPRLRRVIEEEWGRGLVGSWSSWIDRAGAVGDRIATAVVGAAAGEIVVSDSTSVNLYKLTAAALDARPGRTSVVSDVGNFPTDRFVLQGLARQRRLDLRLVGADPEPDDLAPALADGRVALVVLSHVAYRSGKVLDLPAITAMAHDAGALVLWDLSHSAGAVPVDLAAHEVDLAVGCTYKYLNAGPGAPAFLHVRRDLQDELRQPIWGWFGAKDQFTMGPEFEPADGIDRFQVGTPPILGLAAVEEGVALVAEAGIDALRSKSLALTALVLERYDEWLAPLGVELATPRAAARRGGHVSFVHPEAWRICRALIEEMAVVPDYREPDLVRFGLPPLYTSFTEVWEAMDSLRQVVSGRRYERFAHQRSRVT